MAPPRRRTKSVAPESKPFAMAASKGSMPTTGISAASPATRKEITRQQFFKGRPDVSDDRLVRRQTQADELRAFKQGLTIAPGTTNLYQEQAPVFNPMTGRYERTTLADKAQELAFKYGPTPREVLGDIGYGIRSIGAGLGERISQGRFGILGIAKDLYEKFTNSATKAKDALVKGVEKLSDIDLEILKNKGQYKFTSKKPEIQEVEDLQKTQMTEFDKANIIRQGIEQLETTPITGTTNIPQQQLGFKVMPTGSNINNLTESGQMIYDRMKNLNMSPERINERMQEINEGNLSRGTLGPLFADVSKRDIQTLKPIKDMGIGYEMGVDMFSPVIKDLREKNPTLTDEEIKGVIEGTITQPTGVFAAEGGMIDKRLDNIQKKTNNIYGTGILSVR